MAYKGQKVQKVMVQPIVSFKNHYRENLVNAKGSKPLTFAKHVL